MNHFKDRTDTLRQNFALNKMGEELDPNKKVRIACQAGVSDPLELASLLGRPLEETDKKLMFQTLMWGNNPTDNSVFEQEFREWKKTQKWE